MTKKPRVLVLGGGLAGISCAYHLRKLGIKNCTILEKSKTIGGTARSYKVDGFTFDITGHLLHLHYPYTKRLIRRLLKDNIFSCVRNTAIFSKGVYTEYPFQVNTFGLPDRVVNECVEGFKSAVKKYADPALRSTSLPFEDWSKRTFGEGIHKHFMAPYNFKLWQTPLKKMTAEWCGMFVPQPKLEDVIRGSQGDNSKTFGYNATFLYPKRGGIQVLSEALAKGLDIRLETGFEHLSWKDKTVKLSNGETLEYDSLVSTLPLVELLNRSAELPANIDRSRKKLRWTSLLCINLGVNRANISDKSWIYFPEKEYIFYRVGFPMNFTPHVVPRGCSSMYVEVGHPPDKKINWQSPSFRKKVRRDLEKCGILRASDKILVTSIVPVRHAYVVYAADRKQVTDKLFSFLESHRVQSIGRYGGWKYSFMEEAILDGKKAAEKIVSVNRT